MGLVIINESNLNNIAGAIRTKKEDTDTYKPSEMAAGVLSIPTGTGTEDATAVASDILAPKTAYARGEKLTGTITTKAAATITPSTNDQTITAGQYLGGDQTIKAVALNGAAANILSGNSVSITSNGSTIASISGSCTYDADTRDATSTAGDIRSGYTGYVNGSKITGTAALVYTAATKRLDMPGWAVTLT